MKVLPLIICSCLFLTAYGQGGPGITTPSYPRNYFRNPLDIPIFLAGNFGECRPGHFHSGMDIKTKGKENQPVHAAADGYISRIKKDKGGFGHALYITHPNGYTTLYAHLNDFVPPVQKYLKKEQYDKGHWDVDIQIPAGKFPVKKGQLIAWSGNTGASTAPHLHFEIRNTRTEHPLNPELFGLPVVDKMPPAPAEVVFYRGSVYDGNTVTFSIAADAHCSISGSSNSKAFPVSRDTVTVPAGLTGIGINIDDYMDGSDNTIAFYTASLYVDDSLQSRITLDDIGYDETRYINAYADYRIRQLDHKWVQCLFKLPGNHLDGIYTYLNNNNGRVLLQARTMHKVRIVVTDDQGNTTGIAFRVKVKDVPAPATATCTQFFVNKPNTFRDQNASFYLDASQIYDDICFRYHVAPGDFGYSGKLHIGDAFIPVHHYFDLRIRPVVPVPAELKDKIVMRYSDGDAEDGRAAVPDSTWYKARVRNFGDYWLVADTTAPVIRSLQKNNTQMGKAKQIVFEVKDDLTSVKSFAGYLDGRWICFEQHNNLFFYKFDEQCPRGKHHLVFKAEDENGNKRQFDLAFTR